MRTSRPAEELYDVREDPHQIENLADLSGASRHAREDARRRDRWMTRVGDQGLINEPEMIQRMWPGGVQPATAQPYIVPRRTTAYRRGRRRSTLDRADGGRHLRADAGRLGRLHDRRGPTATWRLYTGPIVVKAPMTLRAKAIRYGYKESQETRVGSTK